MRKVYKKCISAFLSAFIVSVSSLFFCMNAFAADTSGKAQLSKGATIFIMISVFIVTAVITGIVSFKIISKKIRESAENASEKKERN